MSAYYYFPHHWAAFIESYARALFERGGNLVLPAIKEIALPNGEMGIAVQVSDGDEDKARQLYNGEQWDADLSGARSLDAVDILARLAWIPRGQSATYPLNGAPMRMLVRLQAHDEAQFRSDFEQLRQAIFAVNTIGMRDVVVNATVIKNSSDTMPHDALVFVARLPTLTLDRWLEKQLPFNHENRRITAYRPYEPTIAVEQVSVPCGIWLPNGKETLPFLGVLAEAVRRHEGSPVVIVEKDATAQTRVLQLDNAFMPLYYFNTFELVPHPVQLVKIETEPSVRKPFLLQLRLHHLPTYNPELEIKRESLEEASRRIKQRYSELKREVRQIRQRRSKLADEAKYIRLALRKVGFDQTHGPTDAAAVFMTPDRKPRKQIYLFFESHSSKPGDSFNWHVIQKIVLESSLAELRNLRYCYCQFEMRNTRTQETDSVAFHLIACGVGKQIESTPDAPPAGLQDADLVFYQDPDWRQLGYNLYAPKPYYLFPPVRPYDHAPKTGAQNDGASDYPLEERRLFNDLLAQAVYAPEGIADSAEARKRIEDFRGSDDLFIVYRDPVSEQLVPIFLRREDFMTLADAPPLRLNQAGLLAGPNYTDPKGPIIGATTELADQVGRALADQYDAAQFHQNVHDLTAQLFDDMVGLLDASLQRRSDELEQRRLENEDELRRKTAELAREIQDLEENWAAVQRRIHAAGKELKAKTNNAEKLFNVLQDRIAYIESLSMQGAENWGEFVTQIVAVAKNLQIEAGHLVQNAAQHIQATNEKFSQAHHDVVNPTLQRINELKQKLDGISEAFNKQTTDDLARTIERLAQVESILKGVHHPASDTAPDLMNDLIAAQQDVEQLRRQITEVENEAENQRRDLIRELNEERRKAAHTASLEQELAEYREQGAKREKELEARFQAHEEIASKLRNERQALKTQVHQASENEKELRAEIDRLTRDTEQAKSKLETELDMLQRLQHQVALNANNVDVPLNHKRFEEIALLVDQMYFAEDTAQPNVAQGLVTIHNQICKSIEGIFQVQRIPIELGKTLFDPKAGHNAVEACWDPQLPEGVILKVVRDGYIHLGKIKREVQVVINQPG